MEYRVVDPGDLALTEDYPCDRRSITEATDLASLAAAVYELAPGEQLPRFYHYHEQREELFYVLDGTLAVETPEGDYEVPEGSMFVAKPDSPHRAFNPEASGRAVRVLGVGAPRHDPGRQFDPGSE